MNRAARPAAILAVAALASCAETPLGYLDSSGGPSAAVIRNLGWGFSIISVAVVLVIALLILAAVRQSRRRATQANLEMITAEEGGVSAIYWGVGLSIPVLVGMAVWTFMSVQSISTPSRQPGLAVTVIGHRWWWEYRYQSSTLPYGIVSGANELVIPAGVPVRVDLQTADVIHSFWVPKLGPKMDLIPGRTNHSWIEASSPGTYRGQCAEFCGAEHGRMGFVVHALAPSDFRLWLRNQRRPANAAGPGREVFEHKCFACHMVRGTNAAGIYGPDLTHFGSRTTIAAVTMANTPANLDRWLADTQGVKPGAQMPQIALGPIERAQLVNWLEALK